MSSRVDLVLYFSTEISSASGDNDEIHACWQYIMFMDVLPATEKWDNFQYSGKTHRDEKKYQIYKDLFHVWQL